MSQVHRVVAVVSAQGGAGGHHRHERRALEMRGHKWGVIEFRAVGDVCSAFEAGLSCCDHCVRERDVHFACLLVAEREHRDVLLIHSVAVLHGVCSFGFVCLVGF